jgi:hypothetical protein
MSNETTSPFDGREQRVIRDLILNHRLPRCRQDLVNFVDFHLEWIAMNDPRSVLTRLARKVEAMDEGAFQQSMRPYEPPTDSTFVR